MSAINPRQLERTRPMSAREREMVRNRMRENEATLAGRIVVPGNRGIGREGLDPRRQGRFEQFLRNDVKEDAGVLQGKIARDQRMLDMTDSGTFDKKQRREMERQVKSDIEAVRAKMCPQKLFHTSQTRANGLPNPKFAKAVELCKREHTEEYKFVANRLKENLRRLDPDGDSNLERFRPK